MCSAAARFLEGTSKAQCRLCGSAVRVDRGFCARWHLEMMRWTSTSKPFQHLRCMLQRSQCCRAAHACKQAGAHAHAGDEGRAHACGFRPMRRARPPNISSIGLHVSIIEHSLARAGRAGGAARAHGTHWETPMPQNRSIHFRIDPSFKSAARAGGEGGARAPGAWRGGAGR